MPDDNELVFDVSNDHVVILPLKFTLQKVRKLIKEKNTSKKSLVEQLLQERKKS